jgi:hypothetical protein
MFYLTSLNPFQSLFLKLISFSIVPRQLRCFEYLSTEFYLNGNTCTSYAHLWSTTLYPPSSNSWSYGWSFDTFKWNPFNKTLDSGSISNHSQLTSYLKRNLYFIIPISILYYFPSSPWHHELMIYVTIFILVSIWLLHSPSLLALLYHCLNHHHHHHLLDTSFIRSECHHHLL